MRIKDIINEEDNNVVSFPSKGFEKPEGINIPTGYDRFELDHKEGSNVASIYGIKNGQRTKLSTGHVQLMRELVKLYNGGKSSVMIEPTSLSQTFGSQEINALKDLDKQMYEKPTYWENLDTDEYIIDSFAIKRLERKLGHKIPVYDGSKIYDGKPKSPLISVRQMPKEKMFIVNFGDRQYLADRSGAQTYIRNWLKIQ